MNEITQQITNNFKPSAALIVYSNNEADKHLEVCKIGKDGRLGSAKSVSIDFMISLCESFSETWSKTPSGILPENMLYCDTRKGKETYVWSNPPQKRKMYFTKGLNIKNDKYNVPGVVYVISRDNLDIYAYKGDKLTMRTKLYKAPFFNVTGCDVCLGDDDSELCDNPSFDDLIEHWETRFWESEFSHLGGNTNPTKTNLVEVTKQAKSKPFDESQLMPHKKMTLETLLNKLQR